MNILVLRTDFRHHGEHSGYKQLLRYIRPAMVLGIDERNGPAHHGLRGHYQWLFEFSIRRHLKDIDVIHVMYGEDYLRFSPFLYPDIPVVATFHQPAESLRREVHRGDLRGRIGRFTHLFTRKRFSRLAAAIVTEESQKKVLQEVMPAEKIHVIPLGVHLTDFTRFYTECRSAGMGHVPGQVVTVGNWLRDWEFYGRVAGHCAQAHPDWRFHLVNRRLDASVRRTLEGLHNVILHEEVNDEELKRLYYQSVVHFLPVTAASGNNALLESLACGCPVLMTDVFEGRFMVEEPAVTLYRRNDLQDAILRLEAALAMDATSVDRLKGITFARAEQFDWRHIADRTMQVYQSLVKK